MTRPPAASMRAAAAITSITMKAGTSLRAEGAINRRAASNIVSRPLLPRRPRPAVAAFARTICVEKVPQSGLIAIALTVLRRTTRLRGKMVRSQADMTGTERPSRPRRTTPAARLIALATATALIAANAPARAVKGPPVVRDAEVEQLVREYPQPILRAAGLAQQNVQVVTINDRSFNAFVADGRRIFVNGGALMESETPNQIIGVLAHETGHIAGGHLARMREAIASATTQSVIAMLLGAGALVAARRSGADRGQAGAAAIAGPTMAIQNTMIGYMRAQEEQADRAAVKFLTATGQSPKGMYETFKRMADQVLYQVRYINPYLQTHPLPSERIAALEGMAKSSPYWDHKDSPALQARHDLMRAKLYGFIERPDGVARRYPPSDTSLAARYARAISAYRFSDPRVA